MSKRDDIQVESKPETYNSFVSPGANFEHEIDTMEMEPNMLLLIHDMVLLRLMILPKLPR